MSQDSRSLWPSPWNSCHPWSLLGWQEILFHKLWLGTKTCGFTASGSRLTQFQVGGKNSALLINGGNGLTISWEILGGSHRSGEISSPHAHWLIGNRGMFRRDLPAPRKTKQNRRESLDKLENRLQLFFFL